jgi:hypothetical protein
MRGNSVAHREVQAKVKKERLAIQDLENQERYVSKN